jgi:gamma-glutamyltranspeptidase/glutathione hydrolase
MTLIRLLATLLLGLASASCTTTHAQESAPAAEKRIFVVAANPLAVDAGMAVLRRGGSAADAAVAVQAMLSLVEPQSSGMGGGAFMTWFDGKTGEVTVYDGRETAPAGASPTMFLGPNGQPLPFQNAVVSGRATGVPGAVRMLATAQEEHGKLPWSALFGEAERTAEEGFII